MFKIYIFCFLISLFLSIFLVPFSNFIAKKLNIYDKPDKRKLNFRKLTRWGGFGMFLSFFITLFLLFKIFPQLEKIFDYKYVLKLGEYQETIFVSRQILGIFFASLVLVVIGTIDDRVGIPALTKFLLQIIIAYCAMDYGVRILGINVPIYGKFLVFPRIISQIVTILWLCGFMNMINLVDGLDGLAAGIVLISSLTFFIISILQKQTSFLQQQFILSSILSLILVGVVLGFLIYNFYPAKLLMGDTGALWLGFIIGCITTIGVLKTGAVISFVIPIIVAGVPFLDIILAIVRRLKKGLSITTADKYHIHHLLLNNGWSEREVVFLFYIISLFLSIIAISIIAYKV